MPSHAPTSSIRSSQRAPTACSRCAQKRIKCDKKIPCGKCVSKGLEASCVREIVQVKGQITSARPVDSGPSYAELLEENARLKIELATLNSLRLREPAKKPDEHVQDIIGLLESQTHIPDEKAHLRTVWSRSDIYLPSRECSNALLEHGFVWTSWIHFAIHIQTFQSEHDKIWDQVHVNPFLDSEPLWLAIYFGFIAMSLMFMDEKEVSAAVLPSDNMTGLIQNWYDASIYFLFEADFLRQHDMRSVQAIAILLGLFKNIGDFSLQPTLQATGIRIAHLLGMDREPPTVSNDPIVQEISRRAWWTLVICEWLQRPSRRPCIHESDFTVNLPLNLDDEELLDPYLRENPDFAPTRPRPVQYHYAMISLAQLSYRFDYHVARFGHDSKLLEELVVRTDEALANVIDELPGHLSKDPSMDDITTPDMPGHPPWVLWQKHSLSLSFLFYRMAINRVLQHRWVESVNLFARSQAICLASAHAIVSLINQHSDELARHRPWSTTSNLFSAAVTLAVETQFSDENTAAAYAEDLESCMTFFKNIQDHNVVAARAIEVLTNYMNNVLIQ